LTNFKKALDIDPNYTDSLIAAGFTAGVTLNLFSEALEYLKRAEIVLKSHNETNTADYADLMGNIGVVYYNMGKLDRTLRKLPLK
jgi:hypothetical protein